MEMFPYTWDIVEPNGGGFQTIVYDAHLSHKKLNKRPKYNPLSPFGKTWLCLWLFKWESTNFDILKLFKRKTIWQEMETNEVFYTHFILLMIMGSPWPRSCGTHVRGGCYVRVARLQLKRCGVLDTTFLCCHAPSSVNS